MSPGRLSSVVAPDVVKMRTSDTAIGLNLVGMATLPFRYDSLVYRHWFVDFTIMNVIINYTVAV